jgi:hypothetical protein
MAYGPAPSFVEVSVSAPSATTSATYVMVGLGVAGASAFTITPLITGRLLVLVTGDVTGVNTATVTVQLSFGTGAAPANNAAVVGTQVGGQPLFTPITGVLTAPFSLIAIITGLATASPVTGVGTPVWLDVALKSTSGAASVSALTCSAIEL